MKTLESKLLMPTGSLAKLKTAVLYGTDAVYLGTPDMSLHIKAEFILEQISEGIEYTHANDTRVYLTLNPIIMSRHRPLANGNLPVSSLR